MSAPAPDAVIVTLTREPKDIPAGEWDWSLWTAIRCDGPTMTRDYYEGLRVRGWRGLEQIPAWCIIDR